MKKDCFNCKYIDLAYQEMPCCLCNRPQELKDYWEPKPKH